LSSGHVPLFERFSSLKGRPVVSFGPPFLTISYTLVVCLGARSCTKPLAFAWVAKCLLCRPTSGCHQDSRPVSMRAQPMTGPSALPPRSNTIDVRACLLRASTTVGRPVRRPRVWPWPPASVLINDNTAPTSAALEGLVDGMELEMRGTTEPALRRREGSRIGKGQNHCHAETFDAQSRRPVVVRQTRDETCTLRRCA